MNAEKKIRKVIIYTLSGMIDVNIQYDTLNEEDFDILSDLFNAWKSVREENSVVNEQCS